jgi:hypothetical protein
MTVRLLRPSRPRVALGSTLAGAGRTRRSGVGLLGLAIRSLIVGIVLGLLFASRELASPAIILALGGAAIAWAVVSFVDERPAS